MCERKLLRKVSIVYQKNVRGKVTPWALELLLLVYRYVSCCLSPTHQNHLHIYEIEGLYSGAPAKFLK